jgi:SnoaL-like domain
MSAIPSQRDDHRELTVREIADRLAIRELIDAYAYCADRRDAAGQMSLFTADTEFLVFMDSRNPEPTQHLLGRTALAPVFDDLNKYEATTHFNGQSTIGLRGANSGVGVSYCLAHHVLVEGAARSLMIASIRYNDTFAKEGDTWLFSRRELLVDWTETRVLQ